ncbi:FtsL-like putative cell division protein [Arcticibacter eurypsychrophilus]|uniref:FtsL-like putative cell division protein n=1 Tax=Arcticibacter eurypsychrophilus TaxID=1434752 RepID=UPI00084D1DA6|nr:FtsL-like putative cell division protein [Arcticibacter eurypsychrophilus]
MSNRFRGESKEEEEEEMDVIPEALPKVVMPRNFFTLMLTEGVISKEAASEMMPFVIFIAFLGMIYIGNRHFTEKNIRSIDKLNKEVKELSWDYKTLNADLMLKSTQTEVAKKVDTLGLKEPVEPPKKLMVPLIIEDK